MFTQDIEIGKKYIFKSKNDDSVEIGIVVRKTDNSVMLENEDNINMKYYVAYDHK
ncbi:MAG: hypothetical protein AABY22_00980 [Nanoarchaeota archaeon]|mgnify:CR=1 FL=1